MRRTVAVPVAIGLALVLLVLGLPGIPSPFVPAAYAQAATDAPSGSEIMTQLYLRAQSFMTTAFQEELEIIRQEPDMLALFLPPWREPNGLVRAMKAQLVIVPPDRYAINILNRATGETVALTSNDGFNLTGSTDSATPSPTPSPTATPSPTPSPEPGESASPSPSPSLWASPSPTPPADAELYRYHPFTLLWPFVFKAPPNNVRYTVTGKEGVYDHVCWVIEREGDRLPMRIWVDEDTYAVCQIAYADPKDGLPVVAMYPKFYALSEGFYTYQSVEISKTRMRPLIDALAPQKPKVGALPAPAPEEKKTPGRPPKPPRPPDPGEHEIPFLGWGLIFITTCLGVGLAYYGGRYLKFLLARLEFSRELILVEAANGPVGRALRDLGFKVVPISMPLLTEERKRLGKKPGAVLPRAVVVAPNSFGLIKGYLFLMRAYVEEGGRVLVMNHSPSNVSSMPFVPYFVPNMGEGKNTLLARPNFFKRLRTEDVEKKTASMLPREFYVEVNQRHVDLDLVQVYNQATGVRSTVVGMVREGQGEYMICQYEMGDLHRDSATTSGVGRLIFLDLIDYLQGRGGSQEEDEKAEAGKETDKKEAPAKADGAKRGRTGKAGNGATTDKAVKTAEGATVATDGKEGPSGQSAAETDQSQTTIV